MGEFLALFLLLSPAAVVYGGEERPRPPATSADAIPSDGEMTMEELDRFYDNARRGSGAPEMDIAPSRGGGLKYSAPEPKAVPATPPPVTGGAEKSAGGEEKGTGGHGVTIQVIGSAQPLAFRRGADAAAAIRRLPAGSITSIEFYGHGAPGYQTVDPDYSLGSEEAGDLLRGKMAPGATLQFTGCNTASIGDRMRLNPAFGLSSITRRLLYFSLPYFQDRLDGRSAEEAREFWEREWNKDLAQETSLQLRGTKVCGYRTFGLVPERLPGVSHLTGANEATSPGYVAGVKACYINGVEVRP
ncbi:MAG: hypothetical protein RDU13_11330 [Elusimicrobiales bacterium]|nr:hypothetical protein [Elusimicrobiales bacterium]